MSLNVNDVWGKTLDLIKSEITQVSYNTWLNTITPVCVHENKFVFIVATEFNKEILEKRYAALITSALHQITNNQYELQFMLESENIYGGYITNTPVDEYSKTSLESFYTPKLNSKYVFDEFVIGNSNRFAHAASLAVAESPAKAYNPLFIYGGVGLGKTHLMHAIGHHVLAQNKNAKVVYVSSEQFTNELINSIKDDKNVAFRNKYRNVDVLLVDDIQFIAGKERTQEEFFHTFNALYEDNKQIILSSDRPPKEIPTLEARLRSRFEWGLITDIQAPDFETRIAILRKKAETENMMIPSEVFDFIARNIKSNIRELEGALTRIIAYSSLSNRDISGELASEALKDIISSSKPKKVDTDLIKEIISNHYNLSVEDLVSRKRTRQISNPRQIAMYITRELTELSLPKIGEDFGGRDHTTVLHAYDKISKEIKVNSDLKISIEKLVKEIQGE
jgi:chromosomal replication initiator protein